MTASTVTSTLSLVITSCGSTLMTRSRMSTLRRSSIIGTRNVRPESTVALYLPSRMTSPFSYCETMPAERDVEQRQDRRHDQSGDNVLDEQTDEPAEGHRRADQDQVEPGEAAHRHFRQDAHGAGDDQEPVQQHGGGASVGRSISKWPPAVNAPRPGVPAGGGRRAAQRGAAHVAR